MLVLAGCGSPGAGPGHAMDSLFATGRWSEARVSVDGPAFPCVQTIVDSLSEHCSSVMSNRTASNLRERTWDRSPPSSSHDLAMWYLVTESQRSRSAPLLETHLGDGEDSATRWNDLAAAYFGARRSGGDWQAFEASLAALEHALQRAPDYSRALYNRALVLETLGLVGAAADAWEDYLPTAQHLDWEHIAQTRLATLRDREQAIKNLSQRSRSGAAMAVDSALARRLRSDLASALLDDGRLLRELGDDAQRTCEFGPADELAAWIDPERAGDAQSLLVESLAWICAEDTVQRGRAVTTLGEAVTAYRSTGPARARELASEAHDELAVDGGPLAAVARLVEGQSIFAEEHYDDAGRLAAMEAALDEASRSPYAVVAARAHERLGSSALRRAFSEQALAAYAQAARLLDAGQDPARLARVRGLEANALTVFGRHDRAWRTLLGALAQANREALPGATILTLCEMGAMAATESQAPHLREVFADCAVRYLEDEDDPSLRTAAFVARAAARQRLGKGQLAEADFQAATDAARSSVEDNEARLNEIFIARESGLALVEDAPLLALEPLQRARDYYRANGNQEGEFLVQRALVQAYDALDDPERAEAELADLVAGLSAFLDAQDAGVRRWRYQHDRDVYEGQVRALLRAGQQREALATLVRLRQAQRFGGQPVASIVDAARPRPSSAQPEVTIVYAWLTNSIAFWRIDETGKVAFFHTPRQSGDGTDWHTLVARAADTAPVPLVGGRDAALTQLYDALLRPALAGLPANTRLHLMPDGPLFGLPWPALRDREAGNYLVQQYEMDVAVELRSEATASQPRLTQPWQRVAVFADPQADSTRPLPAVADDAQVIRTALGSAGATIWHYGGQELTRNSFVRELHSSDLVHYSGHGQVDVQDPGQSRLVMRAQADGTVVEAVTAGFLDELALTGEPMPELVVLAACDTAAYSDRLPHGLALVRPLLESGTRQVMGALRPINDTDYHQLIEHFYHALAAGETPAQALVGAQRAQAADTPAGEVAAWQFVQLYRFE